MKRTCGESFLNVQVSESTVTSEHSVKMEGVGMNFECGSVGLKTDTQCNLFQERKTLEVSHTREASEPLDEMEKQWKVVSSE